MNWHNKCVIDFAFFIILIFYFILKSNDIKKAFTLWQNIDFLDIKIMKNPKSPGSIKIHQAEFDNTFPLHIIEDYHDEDL